MRLFKRWGKKSEAAKQAVSGELAPEARKNKISWLFKRKPEAASSPSTKLKQVKPATAEKNNPKIQGSEPEKSSGNISKDTKNAPPGKAGEPKLTEKRAALITEALNIHRQRQDIWKDIDPNLREGLARLIRGAYGLTEEKKTENPKEKLENRKKNGREDASALTRAPTARK